MNTQFKAFKLTDKVYWVGAIDWGLRDFHGYATERGSTYNAYLVLGDKVTLIDTVKKPFFQEMLSRISDVIDPKKIDFIVSNHCEMDHSGTIPEMVDLVKPEKVIASEMGVKGLADHFHKDIPLTAVKDGESMSLGNTSLKFIETRMIHWPDSMFTYLEDEKILFSSDAFGMHLASSLRYADEIDFGILHREMKKYFANILTPFSPLILKLLEKVTKLNLPIKMVATAHGPIWRKDFNTAFELYSKWSKKEASAKAVIVLDTMWHSTETMAKAIGEGINSTGANAVLLPLNSTHRSDVITEVLDAGALLVGSPTLNGNMLPRVADVLTYMKGLKPQNLIGCAFGSYGWNGVVVPQINQILKEMKIDLVGEGINIKYVPDENGLKQCFELGTEIGNRLIQLVNRFK